MRITSPTVSDLWGKVPLAIVKFLYFRIRFRFREIENASRVKIFRFANQILI